MTKFLGASLGLQSGVSPSRVSAGGARRSEWSGLAVDVLLDDRQRCASAINGEVGRRPAVAAHAGADDGAGELTPEALGGAAFEALGENENRQSGRVGDEPVHVVGFAVDLANQCSAADDARMVDSVKVSMASVNTRRRYFVTNTRRACSSDTLCPVRR